MLLFTLKAFLKSGFTVHKQFRRGRSTAVCSPCLAVSEDCESTLTVTLLSPYEKEERTFDFEEVFL